MTYKILLMNHFSFHRFSSVLQIIRKIRLPHQSLHPRKFRACLCLCTAERPSNYTQSVIKIPQSSTDLASLLSSKRLLFFMVNSVKPKCAQENQTNLVAQKQKSLNSNCSELCQLIFKFTSKCVDQVTLTLVDLCKCLSIVIGL